MKVKIKVEKIITIIAGQRYEKLGAIWFSEDGREYVSLDAIKEMEHQKRVQESLVHKYHIIAQQMRADGFAVVFWSPVELVGVDDIGRLEERVAELGNEVIDFLKA